MAFKALTHYTTNCKDFSERIIVKIVAFYIKLLTKIIAVVKKLYCDGR